MAEIRGKVWRFGDNVDTDQIIPAERLVSSNLTHLNEYIFEKVRPGVARDIKKGDILVAGKNFGCGSSREHAPLSLIQAGFSCIVAESFARIFYRNSMNIGLLLIECGTDIGEGDTAEISTECGRIRDLNSGKEYEFPRYPPFITRLVECGGLVNLIREGEF
ncbi:MAG: 3-isopropylmalate dehydratase [Candidatus Methanoplasma sp.]|jgi:3-isopropylmalate dehydratase small subunit|nr:3-isopropylmalate dehydratase [Candidatus Methanoplasma sp.]